MYDGDSTFPLVAPRRPSWIWTALGILMAIASSAAVIAAFAVYAAATRPVGEGELFLDDGREVAARLGSGAPGVDDLRRVRNSLEIEAVSFFGSDGIVEASTSENLIGSSPGSPTVARLVEQSRFGAIAAPLALPVLVDGVVEWTPGEIVYEVVQPLLDGRAVLLTYDISELLSRRSSAGGAPPITLELLGLGVVLIGVTLALFVGRNRTARTFRQFAVESEYLRRESEALTIHNRELDVARRTAERAFELAEEKNRIRSEFVLMINHELRTPLTGVVTGAELLKSSGTVSDSTWSEVLDDVVDGARRLNEMIDQILSVARIENGALFFELHEVQVSDLIDRLLAGTPRFSYDDGSNLGSASIETDATSVVSLVHSLAGNAFTHGATTVSITATDEIPFEPMVEVGKRPEQPLFLVVRDDGPGIDTDFLPRAFEKFEKRSPSSGTGLGLYIARVTVEALRGSILAATSPAGTSLAIALPRTAENMAAA